MDERAATPAARQPQSDLEQEIRHVVGRLHLRFPDVAEQDLICAVDSEYRRMGPVRVRDFLPVLVERQVRNRLRGLVPQT